MIEQTTAIDTLRANPDWANLPLFDRKGWSRVRFGDVVTQLKEKVDPVAAGVERYVAGEHMETENVHIRKWGNVGDGYLGPAFIRQFRKGQVLYGSRRTYLKKVALAEWDGVTANTTFVLETKGDKLLPELLPWLMLSERFTQHSVAESKGSTNPYINFPDIAKFEFDLPPLDQQRRLADILWTIDQTAVEWGKVAERAEASLASVRKEHFETLIEVSESVALSDVGEWKSGNTPSRSRSDFWQGELPWVSPKDMKVAQIADTEEHLTNAGWERSSTVPSGSILIVIRGMILVSVRQRTPYLWAAGVW